MKHFVSVLALSLAVLLSGCGDALISSSDDGLHKATPPSSAEARGEEGRDRYVLVLDDNAAKSGTSMHGLAGEYDVAMDRTYRAVFRGGTARLSPEQAERLADDPRLARVVPDQPVWATGEQANAPWGLDRIDQRTGTDGAYVYDRGASEVDVYVIDSGIYAGHQDFGGRVSGGVDFVDGTGVDCNGHGTHVAGTAGGVVYGVAKDARLVPMRVLDCNGDGSGSDVIAALDWVLENAEGPSVVNMSLGSGYYAPVNEAVRAVTSAGIPVVVAAGNDNEDACAYSPASEPTAITVAAADGNDAVAPFSNYGDCVDLFAPGVNIFSTYIGSSTATTVMQGTSMASPHVAGVAALLLAGQPDLAAGEVHDLIVKEATQHAVDDDRTANNHMLYSMAYDAALQVETSQYWQYQSVELVWVGLDGDEVQVFRDGAALGTTPNDGRTSITLGWEASGTHRFRVCTPDESLCTPERSIAL